MAHQALSAMAIVFGVRFQLEVAANHGDPDSTVGGVLPTQLSEKPPGKEFGSLCWLEQTEPQVFKCHLTERSSVGHLTIAAGDFNGDAATDIAVGNYPGQDWGAIWWNLKASTKK